MPISYIIQSHMVGPRLIQLLFFNSSPAYFMKLDYFLTYISVLNVHLFLSCLVVLAAELSNQCASSSSKNSWSCVFLAPEIRGVEVLYTQACVLVIE